MPKMLTITGDSIPLPRYLAKRWQGVQVEITESGVFLVNPPTIRAKDTAWEALLSAPKRLMRPTEIEREIQAYRAEQRRAHRS